MFNFFQIIYEDWFIIKIYWKWIQILEYGKFFIHVYTLNNNEFWQGSLS